MSISRSEMIILDKKAILKIFKNEKATESDILKIFNIFYPNKNIEKIGILDGVYEEIEKDIFKSGEFGEETKFVYEKITDGLKRRDVFEYLDVRSDDINEMIEYCIEQNILFISFDNRTILKYKSKTNIDTQKINLDIIEKMLKLQEKIEILTSENLYMYLQKIFDSKYISPIEYIMKSSKDRLSVVINYLIDNILKDENEIFIERIKNNYIKSKAGEIDKNTLYRNLKKLKGYEFGEILVNESLSRDKYKKYIDQFLEEKNFKSFEELQNQQLFSTEKELIEKIQKYYNISETENLI